MDPTNYFFLSLTHHSFTHHSIYLSLYQSLYISTTLSTYHPIYTLSITLSTNLCQYIYLFQHTDLSYLPMSPYLLLPSHIYLLPPPPLSHTSPSFSLLPLSSVSPSLTPSLSSYLPTYLCLSYLHLPTNPSLPAYVYLPTSTYLPIYINIPTYVYLPTYTNLCQPTIIYLPPPIPKYQYIIVADLGTSIGLVLFVEVKGNAAKLCSITVMGYVSLAKSNQIFSCLKSLLNN